MFTAAARLFVALALATTLSSCTQGEGDRCQLDTDCASGLICAVPGGVTKSGGTCQQANVVQDFGTTNDLTVTVPADLATPPDMATDMTAAPVDMTTVPDLVPAGDALPNGSAMAGGGGGGAGEGGAVKAAPVAAPVAVVVPVLDEVGVAPELARALSALRCAGGAPPELAIVDGGSRDGTPEALRALLPQARVLDGGRGRARQMNAGAQATTAPILLFLHADTRLAPGALATVERAISERGAGFGCFEVSIDSRDSRLKLASQIISLRSRLLCSATGDQAIFVRRDLFDEVGGYPEIALCEDLALIGRLCGRAPFACLEPPAVTSARRWERHGVLRTIALMWTIRAAFHLGINPTRLAALYGAAR